MNLLLKQLLQEIQHAMKAMRYMLCSMRYTLYALAFIDILFFQNIFAQKLPFRNYGIKDGLAQSSVNDIYQDSKGYLWFATQSGVSRFDGKTFKTYTTDQGLVYNYVKCIIGDHLGNIWFGTERGGISKFNGKTFENYSTKQGLIHNAVRALLEDSHGNLWIGTEGGISVLPLNDNSAFANFTTANGLNHKSIRALLEDRNGHIWIGTDSGVCKLGFKEVEQRRSSFSLQRQSSQQIFQNFSKKHKILLKKHNILLNEVIFSIFEDRYGNIWFGTNGVGIIKFEPNAKNSDYFTQYFTTEGLFHGVVRCIAEDQFGNIWFGTKKGISKLIPGYKEGLFKGGVVRSRLQKEPPVFENFTTSHGLLDDNIRSILEDNNGNIWIGTTDGGVSMFANRYFEQYSTQQGLVNNIIYCINEDRYGNIWIGTDAGLTKIVMNNALQKLTAGGISSFEHNQTSFQTITIEPLSDEPIISMLKDRNGNLWIGTYQNGIIIKLEGSEYDYSFKFKIRQSNPVTALLEDKYGNIWFGNDEGLTKLVFKEIEDVEDVLADQPGSLKAGSLMAESFRIVGTFNESVKTSYTFTTKDGLIHNEVLSIFEDKYGNIWVGTRGGVSEFIAKKNNGSSYTIVNFTTEQGLAYNYVWPILEDRYGNLWFGTKGGLSKLSPPLPSPSEKEKRGIGETERKKTKPQSYGRGRQFTDSVRHSGGGDLAGADRGAVFKNYTKKDGLRSNAIWLMTMDNEGNIWVGHEKGIEKLIQNDSNETIIFQYYGYLEGFTPMETNANAVFKDSKGNLWFGTLEGAIKYNPSEDHINTVEPKTHITRIRLFGKETDFLTFCDTIDWKTGLPVNLNLPYDQNHITFDFIGIHLKIPEKVRYRYMLEGFDKKWSEITSVTFATYTNLDPDNYTFKVKACNSDGIWNKDPVEMSFLIKPPFWKTGWYYASEILFFIILIGITFYINKTSTKSRVGTLLTFATILFIFEFINVSIEPYVDDFAGGVPVFKLIMNMILAGSLNPLERLISRFDEYI